jgi:hypothetical protein
MRRKKSRSLEISERRKLLDRGIMSFDNTNHDLLALLWQILNDQAFLGFPWIILRDSWVVGDLEADHERELDVRS